MILHYRLIQYVDDPERGEGRNIAVLVHDGYQAYLRALGLKRNGDIDLDYFRGLSSRANDNAWVYGEWLYWFQCLVEHESRDQAHFNAVLDKLGSDGINFVARERGLVEMEDPPEEDGLDKAIDRVLNDLYARLIGPFGKPRFRDFRALTRRLFEKTELLHREDFHEDVEVELEEKVNTAPALIDFPYLLDAQDKPRIGFKIVRQRTNREAFVHQVRDALYTFNTARAHQFLDADHCVVLTEPATPMTFKTRHMDFLGEVAQIIDVTDTERAEARIKSLLAA